MQFSRFNVYFLVFSQLLYYAVIGLPFSLLISSKISKKYLKNIVIAAPIFGVGLIVWVVTLFNFVGLSQSQSALFPIVISLLFLGLILKNRQFDFDELNSLKNCLLLLCPLLIFAAYQNLSDLITVGVVNYFPSTNDDTFNYLSQIDYLVNSIGHQQIIYPASFTSNYPTIIRLGVSGLIANWLALTGWDTHVVFFLTLRCMILVSTVGLYAITLTFGQSVFPAIFATLLFSGSNFFMHQVLQQFLSSTIGIPLTLCLVLLSIVYSSTAPQNRSFINIVISFFCGVLAITSLEAAPFVILPTCTTIFFLTIFKPDDKNLSNFQRIKIIWNLIKDFAFGIAISTGTFGLRIWGWYAAQSQVGLGEHPGNWVAKPEFILQWSGLMPALPLSPLDGYWELSNFPYSCLALVTILGTAITLVLLIRTVLKPRKSGAIFFDNIYPNFAITAFILCGLISQILFGVLGKGYAMLKTTDYYIFQIPLLTAWLLAYLINNNQTILTRFYLFLTGLFICLHLSLSLSQKEVIFNGYISDSLSRPNVNNFVLDVNKGNKIKGVKGDFCGFYAELFSYMNRFSQETIIPDAKRYISQNDLDTSHIFRINVQKFGDINHPVIQRPVNTKELLKSEGYVMICNDLGTNWLPPEGDKGIFWRWLSKVGKFQIFGPIIKQKAKLSIQIVEPGPDLLPGSKVQVAIEDKVVAEVTAKELPKVIAIEIPKEDLLKNVINGTIIVKPEGQGIREVRIGQIFTQ